MSIQSQNDPLRVFVSHSSQDKPFVRRLVDDLKPYHLNLWFDEQEIGVGDSIVQSISHGLENADYLLVILSKASVQSDWVQAELNAALMSQLSNKGITVLPAVIEDCEIPPLLRDRLYADFRKEYKTGLEKLLSLFRRDTHDIASQMPTARPERYGIAEDCTVQLSGLKQIELRRRMQRKMRRPEVRAIWNGLLGGDMDDDMAGRELLDCILDLLDRIGRQGMMSDLIENLCIDCPYLANP